MLMERLILGTAQLGMNYGIANQTGQPDFKTSESIIKTAWKSGIREFDTAQGYGQSEKVLGRIFKKMGISGEARVITKFAPDVDHSDKAILNKALETSMNNLGIESLYGLLLHREDMLDLWEKGLEENLMDIVGIGRVEHIGVSVYSPEKAIQALNMESISMVQLPTSVIDRRFEKDGVFQLAECVGKTIYIRSIYLQGLLLMSYDDLPEHMQFAAPVLSKLALLARDVGLSIIELCTGYAKHAFPNAKIIIGAETPAQVRENMTCWNVLWKDGLVQRIQAEFEDVGEMILDPSLWTEDFVNIQRLNEVQ